MPDAPQSLAALHERASRPCDATAAAAAQFSGGPLVLGASGKMGFHLCLMLDRALEAAGSPHRCRAVSRFSAAGSRDEFEGAGIETLPCDLTDAGALADLPDAAEVFFLAGIKFGTASNPELLHRFNVEMPMLVAERFRDARIAAFSTGCVYSFVAPASGGSREEDPTAPPGAYAESCLGRENAFVAAAEKFGTRSTLIRLNYAVDLRYGVLVDIGQKVLAGQPVDVAMGYANVIWQGDALRYTVQSLAHAAAPPFILNVTGGRLLAIRDVAKRFGELFGVEPTITGEEAPTAWLNNATRCHALFGKPEVGEEALIEWVADWLQRGGETLNKPTHFEVRSGKY